MIKSSYSSKESLCKIAMRGCDDIVGSKGRNDNDGNDGCDDIDGRNGSKDNDGNDGCDDID